jgi:hypothetical protein
MTCLGVKSWGSRTEILLLDAVTTAEDAEGPGIDVEGREYFSWFGDMEMDFRGYGGIWLAT